MKRSGFKPSDLPSVVHLPEAGSDYAAYAVVYGGVPGPPVGLIKAVSLYRERPLYVEQPGTRNCQSRVWLDHRVLEEYGFADITDLTHQKNAIRVERSGGKYILISHIQLDTFLGLARVRPHR